MNFLFGVVISLILIVAWGMFYYSRDLHHEARKEIIRTVLFGVSAFFLSLIIVIPASSLFGVDVRTIDFLFYSGNIVTVIALAGSEEFSKLFVLRHIILKDKAIHEHTDGVFYGAMMGLGFATIENIFYAANITIVSGLVRALLIPLLHSATGAIIGFFLIEKRLHDKLSHRQSAWLAFGIATLFHSLYNYFVIITSQYTIGLLLTISMWIGLLLAVAYVSNTARKRDFEDTLHTPDEILNEEREEGKTYCFLSFFISLLTLSMIFPMLLGPLAIVLASAGSRLGAKVWGKRAVRFAIASTLIGYFGSIAVMYV